MSQEAIIKLLKLAEKDQVLLGELQAARTHEEMATVALNHGCYVRADEMAVLQTLAEKDGGDELSEAELERVGGGSIMSWLKTLFGRGGNSDQRRRTS